MIYAIIPKDSSKAVIIRDDADFKEMLREQLGDHASDYYEMRIKDFEESYKQLKILLEQYKHSKVRDDALNYVNEIIEGLFD